MSGSIVKHWKILSGRETVDFLLWTIQFNVYLFYPEEHSIQQKLKRLRAILKRIPFIRVAGLYFKRYINTKSKRFYDHTKQITVELPMFVYGGYPVEIGKYQMSYIQHMSHAISNNLILLKLIYVSTIHAINPSRYPFTAIELLIKMYFISRAHINSNVFGKYIELAVERINKNQHLTDWEENFLSGLAHEKQTVIKSSPKRFLKFKTDGK